MGAWGTLAFDNDEANDWAYDLEKVRDLSLVDSALREVEDANGDPDSHVACNALAACEVLARLNGNHGYQNAYTEKVDEWVAAHPLVPPDSILRRAEGVIDTILADDSELKQLWDSDEWIAGVKDLRRRLRK